MAPSLPLCIVTLAAALSQVTNQQAPTCKEKLDVVVILQIPSNKNESKHLPQILLNLKNAIKEEDDCNRMGLLLATDPPKVITELSCKYAMDDSCLREGLADIQAEGEVTQAGPDFQKAVDVALQKLSDYKNGARKGSNKAVLIILTASWDNSLLNPEDAVKILHDSGIKVYAVIAGSAKGIMLELVTLSPVQGLSKGSLSDLAAVQFTNELHSIFQGEFFAPLGIRGEDFSLIEFGDLEDQCPYVADVGFLMDSSGSVRGDMIYGNEKRFITRIATKFNISSAGSHAGVILFSSKGYVKTVIPLGNHTTLKEFNQAVTNLPFYGYTTRIDLALELANNELFTLKGGARPSMRKVAILITDGRQDPEKDYSTNQVFDPAEKARLLRERGIPIFAIAVGRATNLEQLTRITGSKDQVYSVDNFFELVSDDFVKKVGQKFCERGELVTQPPEIKTRPITTAVPTSGPRCPCSQRCNSGCCCGHAPIFINIIHGGTNHLMQGLKLEGPEDGSWSTHANQTFRGVNEADILRIVESALSKYGISKSGIPGLQPSPRRNKRSLIETGKKSLIYTRVKGVEAVTVVSMAGAGLFAKIFESELRATLQQYRRFSNLTLIVPSDKLVRSVMDKIGVYDKDLLKRTLHFYATIPKDHLWTYFEDLHSGHLLKSYTDASRESKATMIENARVRSRPLNQAKVTVLAVDHTIKLVKHDVISLLRAHPNLTIFSSWFDAAEFEAAMNVAKIPEKFCLDPHTCIPLQKEFKSRLEELHRLNLFTIFAPSNEAIKRLPKGLLQSLLSDKRKLQESIGAHVLYGTIFLKSVNSKTRSISPSLSDHSVMYMASVPKYGQRVQYSDLLRTKIAEITQGDLRCRNGVLHVVDTFFAVH